MIVPMKRIALVVQAEDKQLALAKLADEGVFHVSAKGQPYSEKLAKYTEELNTLSALLASLPAKVKEAEEVKGKPEDLIAKIINTNNLIKHNEEKINQLNNEINRIACWTDFRPDYLLSLQSSSLALNFYVIDKSTYKNLKKSNEVTFFVLEQAKGQLLIAATGAEPHELLEGKEFVVPEASRSFMENEVKNLYLENRKFHEELAKLAKHKALIKLRIDELNEQIEYEKALLAVEDCGELAIINGFVPEPDYEKFKNHSAANQWGALYSDISLTENVDDVPVKSEYKGLGKLSSTILKMLDLVPGYHEFDITIPLFFFFNVFFAMLVGDAGYGMVFLAIGLLTCFMTKRKGKKIGTGQLFWLSLSTSTIIWGAITGNWFALQHIAERWPFSQFSIEWLSTDANLMLLCFNIALAHLITARLIAFVRKVRTNFWRCFADLGGIALIIGLYQLVLMLLLDRVLPEWVLPIIIAGLVVTLLFNQQQKGVNIFKGMLRGLTNIFPTLLGSVSNFSDVLSYIRLYAVGLAGLGVAVAFNDLAFEAAAALPAGASFVVMALIFTLAHVTNMALALLAVVVHAVRLNSLEFSGHLGQTWSGFHYKPFTAKNNTKGE